MITASRFDVLPKPETIAVDFHCSACSSPLHIEVSVSEGQTLWDCYRCGTWHDISERLDDAKLAQAQSAQEERL